jgi:hypothetical protein
MKFGSHSQIPSPSLINSHQRLRNKVGAHLRVRPGRTHRSAPTIAPAWCSTAAAAVQYSSPAEPRPLGRAPLARREPLLTRGVPLGFPSNFYYLLDKSRFTDGAACLADGAACLADGAACLADGAACRADGAACLADRGACRADSAACLADGAACLADGAACGADGAACLADGATCLAEGAACLADGATCLADGAACLADGAQEFAR